MTFALPTRSRCLAAAVTALSCATSSAPAQAQQIMACNGTGQPLECVITGRRVDGASVVLHAGGIGMGLVPTLIPVPEDLWPVGTEDDESPQFEALDIDCTMPAALDELTHYRRSLEASSSFWYWDVIGQPILPHAGRNIALIFRLLDVVEPSMLSLEPHLTVHGAYAPVSPSGDLNAVPWRTFLFTKELRRSAATLGASGGH
jgi:hypothetical protein